METNPIACNQQSSTQSATFIFVLCQEGEYNGLTKIFKEAAIRHVWSNDDPKLSGFFIDGKHRTQIEAIKKHYAINYVEKEMPYQTLEELDITFSKRQLSDMSDKISRQQKTMDLHYADPMMLLNDDAREKIELTDEGKKLINMADLYQKKQRHIEKITNETTLNKVTPAILSDMKSLDQQDKNDKFGHIFQNNSREKLKEGLENFSVGIKTGFRLGEHEIAFPGGAITVLAAPTNHGKTTALVNFTIGALQENPDKNIHIFSLEECEEMIIISFLNTYVSIQMAKAGSNNNLSKNNKMTIAKHYQGNDDFFSKEGNVLDQFNTYEQQFFEELIGKGRLKIHSWNETTEDLVEVIRQMPQRDPKTCLICIDYMQWLRMEKIYAKRPEELKQICLMLKDAAIETGLPIVLPAQFNREVTMESEMSYLKIGEAGDIERIANLIYGMYNRNFILNDKGNVDKEGNKQTKADVIYIEILKGRYVKPGQSGIFDFDGNKGLMIQRDTSPAQEDKPEDQSETLYQSPWLKNVETKFNKREKQR